MHTALESLYAYLNDVGVPTLAGCVDGLQAVLAGSVEVTLALRVEEA